MAFLPRRSLGEGGWRSIIGTVVRKFFECGDLKHGFARVRYPECRAQKTGPPTAGMGAKELAVLARHQGAVDTEDRAGTEDDRRSHQPPRLQEQGAGPGKEPVPRGEVCSPTPGSADDEQLLTEKEIFGHQPPDAAGSEDHHEAAD